MNLIWGHHHTHKRLTFEHRVFKYADRGFGLRILPQYMKELEAESSRGGEKESQAPIYNVTLQLPQRYTSLESYTKPSGAEPGLKTLKRVAYLAQSLIDRWMRYVMKKPADEGDHDEDSPISSTTFD